MDNDNTNDTNNADTEAVAALVGGNKEAIAAIVAAMNQTTEGRELLRAGGVSPEPGLLATLSGWADVQRLTMPGYRNKIAGIAGLVFRGATLGLGAYVGLGWRSHRRAAASNAAEGALQGAFEVVEDLAA